MQISTVNFANIAAHLISSKGLEEKMTSAFGIN